MTIVLNLIALCGLALMVYGTSMWFPPAGWMLAGLFVVMCAIVTSRPSRDGEEGSDHAE